MIYSQSFPSIDYENGIITNYDLKFTEPSGQNGLNFVLTLKIELLSGGCVVYINPRKLPQLLQLLGKKSIKDLVQVPIMIEKVDFGEEPHYITDYINKNGDFPVNEGEYYGSDLFIEYSDFDFQKNFLPSKREKPPIGRDYINYTDDILHRYFSPVYKQRTYDEWRDFKKRYNIDDYEVGDKPPFDSGIR